MAKDNLFFSCNIVRLNLNFKNLPSRILYSFLATLLCHHYIPLLNIHTYTPLLTPWVPAPDSMAVFVCLIWLAVSTSILRVTVVGYALMSILIVALFRYTILFHRWGAKFYLASLEMACGTLNLVPPGSGSCPDCH